MELLCSLRRILNLVVLLCLERLAHAHTVITYPGWRGDNLHTNGTVEETNGLGAGYVNGSWIWPYGMLWNYPCGGMPTSRNRTKWPVNGGAVAVQPGWFPGHSKAFFYINLGLGTIPPNMSHIMVPPFQITGPSDLPYPGTFCLPQVPLPSGITVKVGDHATIQVIETAQHGASLFNCVDIEFADPKDVEEVTPQNCFNSSDIGFNLVFTTASLKSSASSLRPVVSMTRMITPVLVTALLIGLLLM